MISENFIYMGLLLNSIGYASYIIQTIKGKIKPNRVTFLVISLSALIAFFAQIEKDVGVQSFLTLSAAVFPLAILLSSYLNKHAYWKLGVLDLSCGALALIGLLFWQLAGEGNLAIGFSISADLLALFPTIVKSYTHPKTELAWSWFTTTISSIIVLLTVNTWTFAEYAFPTHLAISSFIIFVFSQFKIKSIIKKFPK